MEQYKTVKEVCALTGLRRVYTFVTHANVLKTEKSLLQCIGNTYIINVDSSIMFILFAEGYYDRKWKRWSIPNQR